MESFVLIGLFVALGAFFRRLEAFPPQTAQVLNMFALYVSLPAVILLKVPQITLSREMLVAADVVRTVALEPTLSNVAALGLLVVIRTFLSWSLVIEIEHRWPWQRPAHSTAASGMVEREG